jgi:tetratricopeptide (TPR) repeat protein
MALAGKGRLKEAVATRSRFEEMRRALPAESHYLINNKGSDVLALAGAILDARLAWARGDRKESVRLWRRAVEVEKAIQYDEPPAWFYPVRQSLAAALLRNGQTKEAEAVFRETIARHPRDGRLLYGLWHTLVAQKRDSEATLVQEQFEAAWKGATAKLRIEDL